MFLVPSFEALTSVSVNMKKNLDTCKESKPKWDEMVEFYQKRCEEGKNYIDFKEHANDKNLLAVGPGSESGDSSDEE